MPGVFSNLHKTVGGRIGIGPQAMIPKLVIGINQVDNLGPWDDAINQPTDKTEKIIQQRAKDIIKKLSSGAHSASPKQIEYYSALRAYRLPYMINRIVHCSKAIIRFRPKDFIEPEVSPGMSEEDRKWIKEQIDKRRAKHADLNFDSIVVRMMDGLNKEQAEEFAKIYAEKKKEPLRVAILGQAGVGKTTTVNNLFNANFKTSRTVVGTDKAQYKDFELEDGSTITIIDLPGYGRSIAEDKSYQQIYINELKHCDIILLIVQANDKALVDDQYMIECLYEWSKEGLI